MKIIGLGHQMQVGKTTIANILEAVLPRVKHISFANGVKLKVCQNYGLSANYVFDDKNKPLRVPGQDVTLRELLQTIGQGEREEDPDYWIKFAFGGENNKSVEEYLDFLKWLGVSHIVVSDVRYPNEGDFIKSLGGVVIKIDRPGIAHDDQHSSEISMVDYDWNFVAVNYEGRPGACADSIIKFVSGWYST